MVDIAEQSTEYSKWLGEINYAQEDVRYRKWLDQSEKIIRRYRDERKNSTSEFGKRRYNILWSNVQTLGPAVYGKMPKPIAERRFLDRDPPARLASLILERTLAFQMEIGGFHTATDKAVLDYLLPGMGVTWVRYMPEFEAQQIAQENDEVESEESDEPADEQDEDGEGSTYDKLTFERVCFDYVYYRDFLWSPSRAWCEVPWIAKRSWLDKSESTEQFGKEIADQMTFGDPKNKDNIGATANEPIQLGKSKKAEVWEIWCKPERCVYFIAPDTPGLVLKTAEDPLKLEGFWPCPEPLFATQTNDTLVPVPDYIEYQDQAGELDDLTERISVITTAIRANGVYDASFPALARLMQAGMDNKLIPVDQWAAFAEKGGMRGAVDLLPMDLIIKVLMELYNARDHVKQDLYEITGMSDILRGATDPNETASAQKIKANYATGRLGARQEEVAEYCRNTVCIAGEIIAEHFTPESLMQMSGIDQMNKEAIKNAVEGVQLPPKPQPPQAQPGQPPAPPQAMQQAMVQWQQQCDEIKRQAAIAKQTEVDGQFKQAIEILRSDKLRGFRVDIETDSTIADDMQNDKAQAVELITGVMKMLEGAEQIGQSAPEMVKPLGGMLMWAYRKYRVGRTLEASLEDALDQIDARIEAQKGQPQPPSAEMITAQAQLQVAQAKAGEANASAQAETQRSQADIQIAQAKLQGEQEAAKLQQQVETLTIQIDSMKAAAANNTDLKKAEMDFWKAILVAQIAAGQANNASEIDAKLQMLLGFGQMDHEKEMQANQQSADAQQAETDAANQPDAEGNTPAPKPRAAPSSLEAMRHKELMDNMSKNHEQVANAIGQVGVGLQQLAKAHSAPKRVVHDANGRPVGVETVN
jgi:hypothetical protein